MTVKERINSDLKTALLSGDKTLATTLRGLKSVILDAEIAQGKREDGLGDDELIKLLQKEAKKREQSVELYEKGGNREKAQAERAEIAVIDEYLPGQISDEELNKAINQAISEIGDTSARAMGQIIAKTKQLTKGGADGGRIAAAVKQRTTK